MQVARLRARRTLVGSKYGWWSGNARFIRKQQVLSVITMQARWFSLSRSEAHQRGTGYVGDWHRAQPEGPSFGDTRDRRMFLTDFRRGKWSGYTQRKLGLEISRLHSLLLDSTVSKKTSDFKSLARELTQLASDHEVEPLLTRLNQSLVLDLEMLFEISSGITETFTQQCQCLWRPETLQRLDACHGIMGLTSDLICQVSRGSYESWFLPRYNMPGTHSYVMHLCLLLELYDGLPLARIPRPAFEDVPFGFAPGKLVFYSGDHCLVKCLSSSLHLGAAPSILLAGPLPTCFPDDGALLLSKSLLELYHLKNLLEGFEEQRLVQAEGANLMVSRAGFLLVLCFTLLGLSGPLKAVKGVSGVEYLTSHLFVRFRDWSSYNTGFFLFVQVFMSKLSADKYTVDGLLKAYNSLLRGYRAALSGEGRLDRIAGRVESRQKAIVAKTRNLLNLSGDRLISWPSLP